MPATSRTGAGGRVSAGRTLACFVLLLALLAPGRPAVAQADPPRPDLVLEYRLAGGLLRLVLEITLWPRFHVQARIRAVVTPPPPAPTPVPVTPPPSPTLPPAGGFGPGYGRPFADTSPFNVAVPANPTLDPNSSAIAAAFGGTAYAILYEFGIPMYDADASSPRYSMNCTQNWGICALESALTGVPVPPEAVPHSGSDGAMVVVDWSTNKSYEFWQARRTPTGAWEASWGDISDLAGTGTGSTATGAGISRLAGVVRTYEIAQGNIDHALVFGTNNTCRGTYRYPATKTDGGSQNANCIPEGARIQLDPSIDVDAIPGITPGEKTVAKALQRHGAYCNDSAGTTMAFSFELPAAGEADPYPGAGLAWDYYNMPHIPWNRLRVLRNWNGT